MTIVYDPNPDPNTIIPWAVATERYPDGSVKGTTSMPSRMYIEVWPLMTKHGGWLEIVRE